MAQSTGISWTDSTWNPVTGCTAVSAGCKYCYAETVANRFQRSFELHGEPAKYRNGFRVTCHDDALEEPTSWRKPRRIFVCSMSDLMHAEIPPDFLERIFGVIRKNPRHTFQILTKRAERLEEVRELVGGWPLNVWLGVTVEDRRAAQTRIPLLQAEPARVRWLSMEPLLEAVCPDLSGIDWVVVGGESGSHFGSQSGRFLVRRTTEGIVPHIVGASNVELVERQCRREGVAFFFKQWGGPSTNAAGRELGGRTYDAFPEPHPSELAPVECTS